MSRARDNANLGAQAGSGLDASDITTGVLPVGVTGGSGLNALSASNLSAGTVPDARFPATLPAASGANLTALPAANLSGTITSGTQDAITRLGTVTAGNLSNTAIVYPSGTGAAHGHVLQVVYAICETELTKTDVGFEDLGLSGTITPQVADSRILCTWVIQTELHGATSGYSVKLWRDDGGGYDAIFVSNSAYNIYKNAGADNFRLHNTWTNLDTPGVTVATTYKVQVANYSTTQVDYQDASNRSSLILMEIVA